MRLTIKAALLLCLLLASPLTAAPWGGVHMTMRQRFAWDDVVVIAQPVKMEPVEGDPVLPGEVHHAPPRNFRVTHVLKSNQKIKAGDIVALTPSRFRQPRKPPHAWLASYNVRDKAWWTEAQPLTETGLRYAQAAAAANSFFDTAPEHVEAFYQFWISDDRWVRDDVRLELLRLNQLQLSRLQPVADRELLIDRIHNREQDPEHRAVALKIFTHVSQRRDGPWLRRMIQQEPGLDARVLPAVFEAYLASNRNRGVEWIEQTIFSRPDADWQYSAREALSRHVRSQRFISRGRGLRALRLELAQPSTWGNDIANLVQLRDWEAMDAVAQAGFDAVERQKKFRYQSAIRYLFRCPNPQAAGYLKRFEKLVPDAYEEIKQNEAPDEDPRWAGDAVK